MLPNIFWYCWYSGTMSRKIDEHSIIQRLWRVCVPCHRGMLSGRVPRTRAHTAMRQFSGAKSVEPHPRHSDRRSSFGFFPLYMRKNSWRLDMARLPKSDERSSKGPSSCQSELESVPIILRGKAIWHRAHLQRKRDQCRVCLNFGSSHAPPCGTKDNCCGDWR